MSKKEKKEVKGGFNLFLGVSVSTLIAALGIIFIVRLLTPSQYGVYTIALIPSTLVSSLGDWGIGHAMIRYLSEHRSIDERGKLKTILVSGVLSESILGIFFSLISYSLAGFLATTVLHRPNIKYLIEISSIIILAKSLLTASQSTFISFDRMKFCTLIMIVQSSIKAIIAPILVFLGYQVFGAVVGHTLAFLGAGLLGILILYNSFYTQIHETGPINQPNKKTVTGLSETTKTLLKYGLPIYISKIPSGLLIQFYSFMMAIYVSDFMIGNYQAAVNFALYLNFFTVPLSTVLFPAFSELNSEKELETLRRIFRSSVKYAALLVTPVAIATVVLSKPLVSLLFGQKYAYASLFLTLHVINYLFPALGSLTLGNFLNGQGKTEISTKLSILTSCVGLPLIILLIPTFGIQGLIATTLVAGLPSLVLGLWWIKKHYQISVDWISSAKTFLSSGIAALIAYISMLQLNPKFFLLQINLQPWIQHMVGGSIFITTYIASAYLMHVIQKDDIENLKELLGPAAILFHVPFLISEKMKKKKMKTITYATS